MLKMAAQAARPGQRLAAARALGGDKVDRDELGRRLRLVASMLRDIGVLLSHADERSLANGDLQPVLARLLPAFDADRALDAFAAVDRALQALDRNASPKIVADWVAFQCDDPGRDTRSREFESSAGPNQEIRFFFQKEPPDLLALKRLLTLLETEAFICEKPSSGESRPFVSVKFTPAGRTYSSRSISTGLAPRRRRPARRSGSR